MKQLLKKIKADRFYNDLVITFIGQMIVMLLAFVLNKIISNQYSVELFGTYNIVRRFISVISFVMLMALGIAIPKYVAEANANKDKRKVESFMISSLVVIIIAFIMITIIVLIFNGFCSEYILGDINAKSFLVPVCTFSLGTCLITYAYSFYRGVNNFIRYNVINILMQIGIIGISFIIRDDLVKLFTFWSAFLIIYGGYEIIRLFKDNSFELRNVKTKLYTMKPLLLYSVPRVPGEFVLFAFNLVPLSIIKYKFGAGQVGLFSAAISINSLITPLFSLVGTILLPLVSKSVVDKTQNQVRNKIKMLGILYLLVSVIGIFFVYFFGEYVIKIMYNSEYVECMPMVRLTILSIVPNAFYLLLRNPIDGISKFPYNTICLIISFVFYVLALFFATSVEMCAIAFDIAYLVLGGVSLFVWKRLCKKQEQ